MGHLKLAVHYDDGVQLYRDLFAQLERRTADSRGMEMPVGVIAASRGAVAIDRRRAQ